MVKTGDMIRVSATCLWKADSYAIELVYLRQPKDKNRWLLSNEIAVFLGKVRPPIANWTPSEEDRVFIFVGGSYGWVYESALVDT